MYKSKKVNPQTGKCTQQNQVHFFMQLIWLSINPRPPTDILLLMFYYYLFNKSKKEKGKSGEILGLVIVGVKQTKSALIGGNGKAKAKRRKKEQWLGEWEYQDAHLPNLKKLHPKYISTDHGTQREDNNITITLFDGCFVDRRNSQSWRRRIRQTSTS